MTFRDWAGVRYRVKRGGVIFFTALSLVSVAALVSANNLLFLIVAAMLATLLISGLVSRLVLAGLELELVLPDHIAAKQSVPARVRLRNGKRLIPSFSIHLAAGGKEPVVKEPLYFPMLRGGGTVEATVSAIFPRRGSYRENLFLLSTRFPFGFLEKTARVALRKDTLVYPSLDPRPGFEAILQAVIGETEQDRAGQGTDLYRIRPYIASENARHVDWKSSAHTGGLQVREYASEESGAIEIVLDCAGQPPQAWFENAVECCAFLVWELTERRRAVSLLSQGFEERGDCYAMLRFLALAAPLAGAQISPAHDYAAFQVLFSAAPGAEALHHGHRALVIGLTAPLADADGRRS